jgi:glycosyltransferase involved in cell wall biosynthesis
MTKKIAFVVQRYGEEVIGGSESLCRSIAEHLTPFYQVEILTTCALNYYDWRNHFPEGVTDHKGVRVRRFRVTGFRRYWRFARLCNRVYGRPHTLEEERRWLRYQGPITPNLYRFLEAARADYASVIFFTYLYPTTVEAIAIAPERSILVPTAHDEPPLYLSIFRPVFHLPRMIFYNTEEEKLLVHRVFQNQHVPSEVVGIGIDVPDLGPLVPPHKDLFFLYLGRIDRNKGVNELVEWFLASNLKNVKLTFAGTSVIQLPRHPSLRVLGEVSEQEKFTLLQNCRALILPSLYESLSLVALEAWAQGTPVIARQGSAVLEGHIRSCGGGLLFEDTKSLHNSIKQFCEDAQLARRMGESGRRYVAEKYSWQRIIDAYCDAVEAISTPA